MNYAKTQIEVTTDQHVSPSQSQTVTRNDTQHGPHGPTDQRMTTAPLAWLGQALYDWGKRGLRSARCVKLPADNTTARRRMTFNLDWFMTGQLAYVTVPNSRLVRKLKSLTREVWPVLQRRGKFWKTAYYLAPASAIACAAHELEIRPARRHASR